MPLFHKFNLLTLNDVFKLEIAKVMHSIENNYSGHIGALNVCAFLLRNSQ